MSDDTLKKLDDDWDRRPEQMPAFSGLEAHDPELAARVRAELDEGSRVVQEAIEQNRIGYEREQANVRRLIESVELPADEEKS